MRRRKWIESSSTLGFEIICVGESFCEPLLVKALKIMREIRMNLSRAQRRMPGQTNLPQLYTCGRKRIFSISALHLLKIICMEICSEDSDARVNRSTLNSWQRLSRSLTKPE